jgi:hypothetical protein
MVSNVKNTGLINTEREKERIEEKKKTKLTEEKEIRAKQQNIREMH